MRKQRSSARRRSLARNMPAARRHGTSSLAYAAGVTASLVAVFSACAHIQPPLVVPADGGHRPRLRADHGGVHQCRREQRQPRGASAQRRSDLPRPGGGDPLRAASPSPTRSTSTRTAGPRCRSSRRSASAAAPASAPACSSTASAASRCPPELIQELETSGCHVAIFRPISPWTMDNANNRNHRRVLVVDGRTGFTGGSGASSKWMGNGRQKGQWRETDVRAGGAGGERPPGRLRGELAGGDRRDAGRRGLLRAAAARGAAWWRRSCAAHPRAAASRCTTCTSSRSRRRAARSTSPTPTFSPTSA